MILWMKMIAIITMILVKYYKLIYINIYLLIYDNMNEDDSNDYNDTTFQKRWQQWGKSGKWEPLLSEGAADGGRETHTSKF